MFQRLSDFSVVINPTKCHFLATALQFLGHRDGLEEKVRVIRDFTLPKSHRKLREFLGLVNFYRRFLPHSADFLYPLTQLLGTSDSGTKEVIWMAQEAFSAAKNSLAGALLTPNETLRWPL